MIWLNLGSTVFAATMTATSATASTAETTMPTMRLTLRLPFLVLVVLDAIKEAPFQIARGGPGRPGRG